MRAIRIVLFAAAIFATSPAVADQDVCAEPHLATAPPNVPDDLIRDLIGWIALRTMYDLSAVAAKPPEVRFCAVGDIVAYEGSDLLVEPELNAAYDLPDRAIYLVLPWSADKPFDRSILLHELIHDVQLSNREWDCIGAPEWEAYELQESYLREHGLQSGFNWFRIYMWSRCPPDHHP